jgi:murein DD-endopeptidase MepM/ murein hydrolase activator NlpD
MSEEDFLQESPSAESKPLKNPLIDIWENISRAGLAETVLRLGTHALLLASILVVAWGMRELYLRAQVINPPEEAVLAASVPTATPTEPPPNLPLLESGTAFISGIPRLAHLHTDVPSRPRMEVFQYTVKEGDTLFGIAVKFGLKPETILWGNQFVLGDNPHNLRPGQELNILPIDGTYHKWSAGDGLIGVAKFFNVEPEKIVNFSGNHLSPSEIGDYSNPNIEPGTWLVIPGGQREYVSWSAPVIPLDDPGVGKVLGPGACEIVSAGAIGSGTFIWPANNHWISGFDYNPQANHKAIDIDGEEGDPVYAADNGVVVYAGWNNWGYGNVVVINHGNGWQTLYGHLSAIYVNCGQSVWQTNIIGAIGNTGNSSGSHLHFELMYNGAKVNPHDYLR